MSTVLTTREKGHAYVDTISLDKTIITTLGERSFLTASTDEADAIAELAEALGPEKMTGLVNWFLRRNGDDFHEAAALIASLRAAL